MEIEIVRHSWPEAAGFTLSRTLPEDRYVLLHFHNPVRLTFGGSSVVTRPGALIVFGPGVHHAFVSDGPLLHDWMHLAGDVPEQLAQLGLAVNALYQPECGDRITELIALLEGEFFARRSHWESLTTLKLTELLILVARDLNREAPVPVSRETAERLRGLRAELLMHPEWDWSNEAMARAVNLSVSRLYPLYRRMFSISPNRDLILMRVERAKNLLAAGESVSRTAERVGYASVYHFIRQFRQTTGVTPGKYTDAAK